MLKSCIFFFFKLLFPFTRFLQIKAKPITLIPTLLFLIKQNALLKEVVIAYQCIIHYGYAHLVYFTLLQIAA
jgi:hypothetical protein